MTTLTDASADGILEARYLSDRRGVLLRAKYNEAVLNMWDFETLGTPATFPASGIYPKVRSSASYSHALTGTSATVPLPPGWQVGDLCYISWSLTATSATLTVPAGWSAVVPAFNGTGSTSALSGVLKRVLQAGDGSVVITHASGRFSAISTAIYDFDPAVPEDVAPVSDDGTGVVSPSVRAPSITPTTNSCMLLTTHAVRNGVSGVITAFTPPSGMTEVREISTTAGGSSNAAVEVSVLQLGAAGATGTKTSTATGTDVTSINKMGSSIAIRPKVAPVTALGISGGFITKHVGALGPHKINYTAPGSSAGSYQWCATIFKSTASTSVVNESVALVSATTGTVTTATFNVTAGDMVVAMVSYNAAGSDAHGEKVTVTNNKSLAVTKAVERGNGEGGVIGGCAIAYMYSSGAQTGMTVTATLTGVDASKDDLVLKVILISNVVVPPDSIPDGSFEGSSTAYGAATMTIESATITKGVSVWAFSDFTNLGAPTIGETTWAAMYSQTVAKTATSPISGLQSLLNTWSSSQQGIRVTLNARSVIKGPKNIRIAFKILGTEAINPAWPKNQTARLEVRVIDSNDKVIKTNVIGFPGNVLRSWSTDFFIPEPLTLRKIEITGYGWDASAAARFDEIKIIENVPPYVRFRRVTDGGWVRGGHSATAVQGVAYAFDDELTPGQFTEWACSPGYIVSDPHDTMYGSDSETVGFTIEDRDPNLPSTLVKSVDSSGLRLYLSTDQREFTRSRSTTFVNKQTTGKPAGGVNSAYSASGDYMLITRTIPEMNELIAILDETVLYIAPTGRYNRKPFYATAMEYTIFDFATMDDPHKTFMIKFQEVERPDTQWQASYLPLRDYQWLSEQYATYNDPSLTMLTYDELAFSAVP